MGIGRMLTWIGNLEQDVLHNVAAVGSLELEGGAVEVDVVETPSWRAEDRRHAALALHDLQTKVYRLFASITSSPTLPAHGVRAVSVGTHTLTVAPCLGDCISGLGLVEAKHLADDSGGCDLDQDYVVETNLVEGVLESHAALNLMCLDHSLQNVLDGEDLAIT